MAEAATITPGESSSPAPATETPTVIPDRKIFIDDPDPDVETPGDAVPSPAETDEDRFDKNPKFQERLSQLREKEKKAEDLSKMYEKLVADTSTASSAQQRQIEELTAKIEALTKPKEKLDFYNVADMELEDFREKFDTDPRDVVSNMSRQLLHELSGRIPDRNALAQEVAKLVITELSNASNKMSTQKTLTEFMDKNKDFQEILPEIRKFMQAHPGHNELSAYHELKAADREKDIETAVKERLKKQEEDALKEGAKETKKPISSGTRPPVNSAGAVPDEVINPSKYGLTSNQAMVRMLNKIRGKGGK